MTCWLTAAAAVAAAAAGIDFILSGRQAGGCGWLWRVILATGSLTGCSPTTTAVVAIATHHRHTTVQRDDGRGSHSGQPATHVKPWQCDVSAVDFTHTYTLTD